MDRKIVALFGMFALFASASVLAGKRLPIIDMHLHAHAADSQGPPPLAMCTPFDAMPAWDPSGPYPERFMAMFKADPPCDDPVISPMTEEEIMAQTLEVLERLNIIGVVSGDRDLVKTWRKAAPDRLIPGLHFNLATDDLSVDALRRLIKTGEVRVFGEIVNQYAGIAPDDERMEPYWALAEELDIPVGIHVGTGPPGVIYLGASGYRARLHSALTMEEVLVRHPGVRVYLMHAGYPMLDDLLAVLYAHPQVYVDIGVIVYTQPRDAFYRYLKGIVDAGFGERVMFGSDQMVWPGVIERAIAVIQEAPFLSEAQKRDILYHNAARFLRLSEEDIARHHEGAGWRRIDDGVFVSSAMPEIRLRVDPRFEYIGPTRFVLKQTADVERHHWVMTDDGEVTAMVVLQFEGLRDGIEGKYSFKIPAGDQLAGSNYRFAPARIELGGMAFVHNTWAYDNGQSIRDNPGSEPAHTARLLARHGYTLDDELIMSRFVTEVGPEQRDELIVFYIEPLSTHGKTLADFPDGEPASDGYDALSEQLKARSLEVITWIP